MSAARNTSAPASAIRTSSPSRTAPVIRPASPFMAPRATTGSACGPTRTAARSGPKNGRVNKPSGSVPSGLMDLDANRSLLIATLARIPLGDRAALQTVYRLTSAKLFGVCLRILGERADAEDVLQEVYVTVWRKAADFDPVKASPMTWLIAIARNRAIDRLRADKQGRRMEPIDAAAEVPDSGVRADAAL